MRDYIRQVLQAITDGKKVYTSTAVEITPDGGTRVNAAKLLRSESVSKVIDELSRTPVEKTERPREVGINILDSPESGRQHDF